MFPCFYTAKISALVTCCILDHNQNPHLSAKYLHTTVPLLKSKCYLWVVKIFYHHRDNSSMSVGRESKTNILFIGTELFGVQSGGTIFVEIRSISICLQRTSGNHYLWLEGSAARKEARAPVRLTRWTTHRPLDGICDKAILPLDDESLSALVSRQCYILYMLVFMQNSLLHFHHKQQYLLGEVCRAVKTR